MKRLFILSAAVAALASCSNSEVITEVNEPQVPDKAIAFETFSSNATRESAENSGATTTEGLEKHHSNFSVWGYKDVAGSDISVFNRRTVSHSSSTWTYSPIRFWDKGANSYKFYACAPADAGTSNNVFTLKETSQSTNTGYAEAYYFTTGTVTLQAETLDKTTYSEEYKNSASSPDLQNTDYMIASKCEYNNVATAASSSVQLDFNHILSRLNITVQKARKTQDEDAFKKATVSLKELSVHNMILSGSFDEGTAIPSGTLVDGTTIRWNTSSQNATSTSYTANTLTVEENPQYVLQSLVIPQTVAYEEVKLDGTVNNSAIGNSNKPYIYIKYNIKSGDTDTGETFVRYINLAKAFGKSSENESVAFNEGWQNTLHITIDADVISFKTEVYKWDTKHENNYNAESGSSTPVTNP